MSAAVLSGAAPTATLGFDAAATLAVDLAVAQSGSVTGRVSLAAAQILGLSLVAAGVATVVALLYRWYVRERVPGGLPALFGLSAIVPFLGASQLLRSVITPDGSAAPIDEATALFNIAAFLVALGATRVGTAVGDHIGTDLTVATGERAVESEVGRVVQAVGRVITVELPDEVEDIVGYDPVPTETKENIAGTTLVFPRRLTVPELRDRLVTRLKADYAVGHVDVELADDGTVEYLAVGARAAGIGPTLPPETSAVAVRADPAFAASAGDLVQVWRTDPFERVLTAEVRGSVDDVVTLAVDAADTRKLDAEARYKLVTLPVETRPDREFASVLRAAEETMAAVTVAEGSDLVGQPVGAVDVAVVAIRPQEGPVEPLPARDRTVAAGDALYVVATPEAIRKVEIGASLRDGVSGGPSAGGGAHVTPEERVDATTRVADGTTDGTESASSPPDSSESAATESDGASTEPVDDFSDADTPGIQTLEEDESGDAVGVETPDGEDEVGGDDDAGDELEGDEDGEPPADPTREDLETLAGTDLDDLTGSDVTLDGSEDNGASGGEWTNGGDTADDGDTAENSDTADDGDTADEDTSSDETDASDDGSDAADADDGDWSVAVDQRRDEADR